LYACHFLIKGYLTWLDFEGTHSQHRSLTTLRP